MDGVINQWVWCFSRDCESGNIIAVLVKMNTRLKDDRVLKSSDSNHGVLPTIDYNSNWMVNC